MQKLLCKVWPWTLFVIALVFIAFWWGEAGGGLGDLLLAFVSATFISLAVFLAKQKIILRLISWALLSALLMLTFMQGQSSNNRTYNTCEAQGETVRIALYDYYQVHKSYPKKLSELNIATPCNRILRSSILSYEPINQGYQLRFSDWLMTFVATEQQGFEAHK